MCMSTSLVLIVNFKHWVHSEQVVVFVTKQLSPCFQLYFLFFFCCHSIVLILIRAFWSKCLHIILQFAILFLLSARLVKQSAVIWLLDLLIYIRFATHLKWRLKSRDLEISDGCRISVFQKLIFAFESKRTVKQCQIFLGELSEYK